MERAIRSLMGANLPPRFKFKDTYASIEVPTAYTQHLPTQQEIEDKFTELETQEEAVEAVAAEATVISKFDSVITSNLEVGTSNLFVDTETGRVGIGTTNPQEKVHINDTGAIILPYGTTAQRNPTPPEGSLRLNTTTLNLEYYLNSMWRTVVPYGDGSTQSSPVPSAQYLLDNNITSTSGTYWIRPVGYNGNPFQVYCDLTGTTSGIGTGGWMRVEYSADKYSQSSPWTLVSGQAYSGDFSFSHTNNQINAMKNTAAQIRQTLDSYGRGSVGWTYSNGSYMGCKTLDGSVFWGSGSVNIPSNTDYSFSGWNSSGVVTPRGTDPTDTNDGVWRRGLIYLVESGNTYLPILGIYNSDVDATNEERYFPLSSGNASFIWIR